MCTANFYCDQITVAAVQEIATYLGILPELIEEAAHVFKPYENSWELVVEQSNSRHPQNSYRFLRKQDILCIYNGHVCTPVERD